MPEWSEGIRRSTELTGLELVLESARLLEEYGFRPVDDLAFDDDLVRETGFRLYEDVVSLVGIAGFESWPELASSWLDIQDILGRNIGRKLTSSDAKAWDTYLVLLVGQQLTPSDRAEAVSIRYNTRRARKIVVTGDEVRGIDDLELALMPVRPVLAEVQNIENRDPLDDLVDHISDISDPDPVRVLVDAYRESRLLLEALHVWRTGQ